MAGVATGVGAGGQGEGAAVASEALTNISTQAVTPETLVDLVDTPEKALKVVKHEVARRELFTEKKDSEFLPKHEDGDGSTVVASNVWNREQLKNLNLCGKDVTNTFVLLDGGETKLLGDFIQELGNPEAVKKCLQGLVYNADTKFSNEEKKNKSLLDFLGQDKISSEYTGNGNELVQVASLVEPPLKRFTDLLIPSEAAARPEFAGADDAVEAGTPPARRVGDTGSAGDADTASLGQVGPQQQSNTSENEAPKPRDNGEDTDLQDSLRRALSKLLSSRAQFIRREVSPSEEADSSNGNREIEEDDHVELVKAWLRKQFSSESFGAIREVVSEDSSESESAAGVDSRSNEDSAEKMTWIHKLGNFHKAEFDLSKEGLLSFIKECWERERNQEIPSISNEGNGSSFMNISRISDGSSYIDPCSRQFEKGLIDPKLIDQFYDVEEGKIGNCYDITELAEIDIDTNSQTFAVKSKGKLFLPPDHPYFTENPTPSS
jgi:hypothetical protein